MFDRILWAWTGTGDNYLAQRILDQNCRNENHKDLVVSRLDIEALSSVSPRTNDIRCQREHSFDPLNKNLARKDLLKNPRIWEEVA